MTDFVHEPPKDPSKASAPKASIHDPQSFSRDALACSRVMSLLNCWRSSSLKGESRSRWIAAPARLLAWTC